MSELSIVMYHYVRPIAQSRFPRIRGLEVDGFRAQLDFLTSNYTVVTAEQVTSAVRRGTVLPDNACWLTFDDGYRDHFDFVLPELLEREIQGSFFVPVAPVVSRELLDVNAIHYILASQEDHSRIVRRLKEIVESLGLSSADVARLWLEYGWPSRYDTAETMYVKRLLQFALPEGLRNESVQALLTEFVGVPPEELADELYMSREQVRALVDHGMYVGSHGTRHVWLNKQSDQLQEQEIDRSLAFLLDVGASIEDWVMCYPYGGFNLKTLEILEDRECAVGLTTQVGPAFVPGTTPLTFPRFDTNDFPQR